MSSVPVGMETLLSHWAMTGTATHRTLHPAQIFFFAIEQYIIIFQYISSVQLERIYHNILRKIEKCGTSFAMCDKMLT